MIRFKIAEVMGRRMIANLSDLARQTGINRLTIKALYDGSAKGIQWDALDSLCSTLKVQPSDLVEHVPPNTDLVCEYITDNPSLVEDIADALEIGDDDVVDILNYFDSIGELQRIPLGTPDIPRVDRGVKKTRLMKYGLRPGKGIRIVASAR